MEASEAPPLVDRGDPTDVASAHEYTAGQRVWVKRHGLRPGKVISGSRHAAMVRYRQNAGRGTTVDTVLARDLAIRTELDPGLDAYLDGGDAAMLPARSPKRIRSGEVGDCDLVVAILTDAFAGTRAAVWLVPDPVQRRLLASVYLRAYVRHGLERGIVRLIDDAAVALWFPRTGSRPELDGYARWVPGAAGAETTGRVQALERALVTRRPSAPHHYLQFVAVHPLVQGRGLGSALLEYHHAEVDRIGLPAYVEVDPGNRGLFEGLGYAGVGVPVHIEGGAVTIQPMLRRPRESVGAAGEGLSVP